MNKLPYTSLFTLTIGFIVCNVDCKPMSLVKNLHRQLLEHSTKNFKKHLTMSLKFTRTEVARITAFPGKLKGVHSQEDSTNIFPSQLHNMSDFCAFHHEHP